MKRLSIRKQLLTLFVPSLLCLYMVSALISSWLVSGFSGDAFDRDLINSADSVVGRLRMKDGKVVVDLPPAAQAILKHDESDKFYYCVLGMDGQLFSGDANIPKPSIDLEVNVPKVLTATIDGNKVKLVEIKASLDEADGKNVIVQVAETTNFRTRFQERMFLSIAVPQLLAILLGLWAVWYGVAKILTPLRILQHELANRSQTDLSGLSDDGTPEEVYPLVMTLNHLLNRLREDIKAHQRFIANAAHQLRTPLAGLKTYSSIGSEMTQPEELKHIVKELDQGIDRASRIVAQLLALARTDGGESNDLIAKNSVDLNFLVSDVVAELVGQSIRKNIELTFECSQLPATISGDKSGLRHLIANLIENSILYTDAGGKIVVSLSQNESVILCVSDTGRGIPIDERERVFERFYRVPGTTGNGSGLGLSIVKEVAKAHNATVLIQTSTSGGTLFTVKFPAKTS